jgi:hypothetical protein
MTILQLLWYYLLIRYFSCINSNYAQRCFRLNTKRNYAIIFLIDNFHVLPLIVPNGVLDLIQKVIACFKILTNVVLKHATIYSNLF